MTEKHKLRFLIIQLRQIGDVLISTTVCETLKKNYPNAQVDYVVYPYSASIAENNPYIDNLIVIPNGFSFKKAWEILKVLRFMRQQQYDYAVEILNTPKSIWIARLSGAKTIIGQASLKRRAKKYDIQVKYMPSFLPENPACHSVKNRLCLLEPISKELKFSSEYRIYLKPEEIEKAQRVFVRKGIDLGKPLFYFNIGSRSPAQKQWDIESFIHVMTRCQKTYNAQILLCPGPGEEESADYVKSKINNAKHLYIFNNQNLREMAAMLSLCDLFVGNDSGPRHIAIAVNTPSVAIFSPAIQHHDWHPKGHPHHLAINIQEVLKLSDEDYKNLREQPIAKIQKYYKLLTPELVLDAIAKLCSRAPD